MRRNYQVTLLKEIYAFDLIDKDVLLHCASSFSFFFKDLNVLPAALFTIAYRRRWTQVRQSLIC